MGELRRRRAEGQVVKRSIWTDKRCACCDGPFRWLITVKGLDRCDYCRRSCQPPKFDAKPRHRTPSGEWVLASYQHERVSA